MKPTKLGSAVVLILELPRGSKPKKGKNKWKKNLTQISSQNGHVENCLAV